MVGGGVCVHWGVFSCALTMPAARGQLWRSGQCHGSSQSSCISQSSISDASSINVIAASLGSLAIWSIPRRYWVIWCEFTFPLDEVLAALGNIVDDFVQTAKGVGGH